MKPVTWTSRPTKRHHTFGLMMRSHQYWIVSIMRGRKAYRWIVIRMLNNSWNGRWFIVQFHDLLPIYNNTKAGTCCVVGHSPEESVGITCEDGMILFKVEALDVLCVWRDKPGLAEIHVVSLQNRRNAAVCTCFDFEFDLFMVWWTANDRCEGFKQPVCLISLSRKLKSKSKECKRNNDERGRGLIDGSRN